MSARDVHPDDPRRGVVLVTVLWSIALLSALAMAAAVSFRGFAGVAGVDRNRIQGDALLTAGLEAAAGTVDALGAMSGTEIESVVALSTGSVRAHISDEGGRIDIGKAPVELLASLFRAAGAPPAAADDIARRIAELRDRNDGDRPNGGRANASVRRTPSAAPQKPGAEPIFTDLRDLARVGGVAPQWIAAMAPLATVFGNETVNPLTAPPAVIAALPGVTGPALAAFLEMRRAPAADPEQLAQMLGQALGPAQRFVAPRPQRVLSVELTARLANGYAAAARAVIVRLPQDREPYRILAWNPLPPPARF
jgi:general secretion pathway protein K